MNDRIALPGLRVRGHHGVFDFERRDGQDFLVDVMLELDTAAAAASDDLTDTVDYGGLAQPLAAVISGEPVDLIETARRPPGRRLPGRPAGGRGHGHRAQAAGADPVGVRRRRGDVTHPAVTGGARERGGAVDRRNLGDRLATLQGAVEALRPWVTAVSAVYETPPWGPVPQGDFLNAVVLVDDPAAAPRDWLERAHAAENAAGRTREVRWGPRTLDVDVVAVTDASGPVVSDDPVLTLPHPRAAERAFVLVPWLDADPAARLGDVAVAELVAELDPHEVAGVRLRPGLDLR